jgi:hypothetical protein
MNIGKLDEEAIKKAATEALDAFMADKLKAKADEWNGCETVVVTMEIQRRESVVRWGV